MLSAVKGFARLFLLFLVIHSLLVEFFSSRYGAQKEPSRPKKPEVQKAKPYDPFARFLQSAFWYQALVQAGGRKPRDHFVRLVTLVRNREPEEIFQDICSQRLFMAKLILKLKISQSAVIVIDKFFPVHSCPDPMNEGNRLLGQALQDSDVPIVLGLRTSDPDELAAQ